MLTIASLLVAIAAVFFYLGRITTPGLQTSDVDSAEDVPVEKFKDPLEGLFRADAAEEELPLPFDVVDLPGKGKGAIANRDIEVSASDGVGLCCSLLAARRIDSQRKASLYSSAPEFVYYCQLYGGSKVYPAVNTSPLTYIAKKLAKLTPAQRASFWDLSYVNVPDELDNEENREVVALAIMQTNAVSAGENVGIFPRMARLNHGCSSAFNVVYFWRENEQILTIYAMKSIKKGQVRVCFSWVIQAN